jgi:transcriptional regulator with XRE-family HTH domain
LRAPRERVVYTTHMSAFGEYVRRRRELRRAEDADYSVRRVAGRVGIEPSYLSKIERSELPPPSEETIRALAADLGEDPDVLLALGGKVSSDLQRIIRRRPALFAHLIRELKDLPDHAVLRLVREVRDGEW